MSKIRFIGDVHGKFRRYREVIRDCPRSIQVGDMGVGFINYGGPKHGSFSQNPPFDAMSQGDHKFIRGNHDNPSACKEHKFWIPDGTIIDNMMFIGGAISIDRESRIRDYSWWHDEELSITELNKMIDIYEIARPEIVVTHECPEYVASILCLHNRKRKFDDASRTRQAFQSMFEIHKPRFHFFGHWHLSFDMIIEGTRFICLNELEWVDFDTDNMEIINRKQNE